MLEQVPPAFVALDYEQEPAGPLARPCPLDHECDQAGLTCSGLFGPAETREGGSHRLGGAERKSRYSEEKRVAILREADRSPVSEVAEKHAVSEQTIDNWRQHFGTMESVDTTGLRAAVGGTIDAGLCVADVWQGCAGAGGDASAVGSVPALRVSAHPRLPGTSGVPDGSRPGVASMAHEAKVVIEQWRRHDYEIRPHSSLAYRTPNEFVQQGCSSVKSGVVLQE